MAQKPVRKKYAGKKNPAMEIATKIFAAGACAEAYLLMIYHFYVRGTVSQVLSWHDLYLPALPWVGLVLVAAGLVILFKGDRDNRKQQLAAKILVAAGVFVAVTAPMIRTWYTGALTPLCVVVPGLMILGIAWCLYDRECVYALAILSSAAMMLWICRECLPVPAERMLARGLAVVWLVLAAAVAVFLNKLKAADGVFRDMKILPPNADYLLIYIALGISAALVLAGMLTPVLAYYAIWAVVIAIFALAVYYTVQQL